MEEMVNTFIPRLDWARVGHLVAESGVLQSSDNTPHCQGGVAGECQSDRRSPDNAPSDLLRAPDKHVDPQDNPDRGEKAWDSPAMMASELDN